MYTYPENLSTFSKFIEHQKKRGNIKRQKVELNTDSLNAEQRLGLAIVQKVLENNGDQLLMYLHGVAGTGKSHLLACIRDLIESKCGEDGVIVAAPTGVAAYNINGETLHSAFALGLRFMSAREEEEGHLTLIPALTPATELVQHVDSEKLKEQSIDFEKDEEMEVEREVTRKLRVRLQSTRFIIIDEISMVGAKAFAAIERKIRVLLNSTLPFGGRHVIISGDIGQLRPIYDAPLFAEQYLKHGRECLIGMRLYHEFRTVVILHQVVRQEGEEQARFRTLLLNVRKGVFEEEDLHLLNTRQVAKIDENEKKCLDSITHIFPYRRLVKHQNSIMLKRLGNPVHEINFETKEGLSDQVEYAVGARVMLVRNLFVKAGLVNGAKGYIRDIVYNPGESSPSVPKFIMVRFDEYCGEYPADMDALPIPATPMTWDIPGEKGPVWITMGLPLVPAYSSTIHKTQGLTVDKLAIDFKNSKFVDCTMFFVAISRAKHLNDIVFLSDFSQPFVDHLRTCKHNDNMLIEEARLHDLYQNVLKAKME